MAVRAWVSCVLLAAGLAHAAEQADASAGRGEVPVAPAPSPPFAAGSVVGPWAWTELGGFLGAGTFVEPRLYGLAGFWTDLSAGWGFEAGRVHLRPSARFSLGVEATLPDSVTGNRVSFTPLALSLAAANLIDEPRTGLRLTPAIGLTIPTWLDGSTPLTTASFALQLERRFGPVEFGLRSELGKPIYVALQPTSAPLSFGVAQPNVNWSWANSLQAEGWITESLSLGLSFGWNMAWRFSAAREVDPFTPAGAPAAGSARTDLMTGRIFGSWAFMKRFGLSLEMNTTQPPLSGDRSSVRFPFLSLGNWANNTTVLFLSVWFRTDATLARNWIER
ncbi:MAG: hypothetical protein Q8L48_39190 [Archangium sp.]|nr:hypothetical protein [Archangium sp.]